MSFLQKQWKQIKAAAYALQPAVFSIIVLILGFALLVIVSQGRDLVLALSESFFFKRFFFGAAALLWAVQIWYWARLGYILRDRHFSKYPGYPGWAAKVIPRILGILAFFVVTYALFDMARFADNSILTGMGVIFLLLMIIFYIFLHYRRKIFKLPGLEDILRDTGKKSIENNRSARFSDLPAVTRKSLVILTAINLLPLVLFTIDPQTFTFEGGAVVALLCISMWVPLGSWILYLSHKWEIPLFSILLVLAIISGLFNDNHHVRVLKGEPQQMTLDERLDRFLAKYPAKNDETGVEKPLYIVSTEGGGIRSAYWTTAILCRIQEKYPEFKNHLFAISAVSGGSLGAAVFTALLKEKQEGRKEPLVEDARNILKRDFLSPTIAMMLTGDMLQRFLPFPIDYFCRQRVLEESWENAWKGAIGTDRFAKGMTTLWENDDSCGIPSLFINGTMVESGQRVIASNVRIDHRFLNAYDVYSLLKNEMRLSTAVSGSSRAAYVGPAGTLCKNGHIVDGGYFDDSGTTTVLDILSAVKEKLKQHPKKVKLVMIMISNYPVPLSPDMKSPPLLFGILAPLQGTFSVIKAYAHHSQSAIRREVEAEGGTYLLFVIHKQDIQFPMGWALSLEARKRLDQQAAEQVNRNQDFFLSQK